MTSVLSGIVAAVVPFALGTATTHGDSQIGLAQDVARLFQQHCVRCHSPGNEKGDLSLATIDDLLQKEFIVQGDPDASYLVDLISSTGDERPEMPQEGPPLSSEQVKLVRRWIAGGANWPKDVIVRPSSPADAAWWSLKPPEAARPPSNQGAPPDWKVNPIDAFILHRLREQDLTPSPPADRRTLIRRVTLDLTGLPPSPDAVDAFLNDPTGLEAAYARVVTRLLDSPRYGERWAQHWLDVIRWAETVGFETNLERPHAWPYRDWVIASLNADKPYDRFVLEQIAGDTVGEDAALGFLVAGPANLPGQIGRDEPAMRQARQDELDEVIRTVSQGLFGLTIGCARCHDHKFDPITQQDYYALQAIFAGLSYGDRRLRGPTNDRWTPRVPDARRHLVTLESQRETLRKVYGLRPPLETVQTDTFDPVRADAIRMRIEATGNGEPPSLYEVEVYASSADVAEPVNVALASTGSRPSASGFALANQTRHFDNLVDGSVDERQAFPWVSDKPAPAWIRIDLPAPATIGRVVWHAGSSIPADYSIDVLSADSGAWKEVAHTRDRLLRIDDTRVANDVRLAGVSAHDVARIVETTAAIRSAQKKLARLAAGPQVHAARFTKQPEPTWLLRRGDPMQRVACVSPAVPVVLQVPQTSHSANPTQQPNSDVIPECERRLALSRHLTRSDHPLTARVMVNRAWQHHFGTGLSATPSDFGRMGAAPSHPDLLDWLAVEFVNAGWSLKHLHRLIVTSQTYRQSSRPRMGALRVDADSRWLWRFPPRRLEAEAIRDSILVVSGKLNLRMGGPGFDFFDRRGGLSDYTPMETFDEDGWRRMVYAHKIRMQAVDIFGTFDCPDAGQMTPRRTRSITPLQSLSLLNSPFVNRQAAFFAERVRHEVGDDPDAQIDHAFQLALSRHPDEVERGRLVRLASDSGLEQVCRVLFNTSEFVFLQ